MYSKGLTFEEINAQKKAKFLYEPLISIIVPVYNPQIKHLKCMVESVLKQTYAKWELCIANAGESVAVKDILGKYEKKDKRIKVKQVPENRGISGNSNEALAMAQGEYIALLDHDDTLSEDALFENVMVINKEGADIIYSDEDHVDTDDKEYFEPYFKPNWSPYFFLGFNYLCHFIVFNKKLISDDKIVFRNCCDGAQDYDLLLRITERTSKISHIPQVLYHWRVHSQSTAQNINNKSYTIKAGERALQECMERRKELAIATSIDNTTIYRTRYTLLKKPLVSIIIPNYNNLKMLKDCIDSIVTRTTYNNYEIIIIENNSDDELFKYYNKIQDKFNYIKVVYFQQTTQFSFSKLNNWARQFASGEYFVFLNNDTKIITPEWIELMLEYAQRDDVGCVGVKLLYEDQTMQHAGILLNLLGGAGHVFLGMPSNYAGYFSNLKVTRECSAVTGACLMINTILFESVGGFEEELPVSYNDVDLCMKMLDLGKKNLFVPYVEVYHYESKTRGLYDTEEKIKQGRLEEKVFKDKWNKYIEADPYYNPNLSLNSRNFEIK